MINIPVSLPCVCGIALILVSAGCMGVQSEPLSPAQSVPVVSRQQVYTSNETLAACVDSAAAYVQSNGAAKALAEFNNPNGSVIKGERYMYAYGFNGRTLAHPVNPETVGKTPEGAIGVFVTEMGEVVRNGNGFYRFTYVNPQ